MNQTKVVSLVALLMLLPTVNAAWIDDAESDAETSVFLADADHGRAGMADIHSVDIAETEDWVHFTVLHGDRPDPNVALLDAAGFEMEFNHGSAAYRLYTSAGTPVDGGVYYWASLYDEDYGYLGELDTLAVEGGFKVDVPKNLIRDGVGQRPTQGTQLTNFVINSASQSSVNICVTTCASPGYQSRDRAPDEGVADPYDFQFGLAQDGDIRLLSPAPVRWSNGEATTFVYELVVENIGKDDDVIRFDAKDVPQGWQVARIGTIDLAAGEQQTIPLPVKIPFAHAHGTDPRFIVEARGLSGVGRIELGVHHPAIPQPTGHHAELFIHTREAPVHVFQETLTNALGGGLGEAAFMNTANPYEFDESVPVKGTKGDLIIGSEQGLVNGDTPDYGMEYVWAIPLSPGLHMGLQTNQAVTEGEVTLQFDVPAGTVAVEGVMVLTDFEADDLQFNYRNHEDADGGEVARIELTDRVPIAASVTLPFTVSADPSTFPYQADKNLVLFVVAHVLRPDAVLTPNTGVYLAEGNLVLPLNEYHDALPVNVSFPEEVQLDAVQNLASDAAPGEAKESPTAGAMGLLGALAMAIALRRLR